MDIGVTISKVRKEYREYLRETHPDWADTTISTHVSDAFYLYQNTIALSFWKCFESDASMEKAKGEIFDYLKQEVMSDRADERTAQYYRDLKRLKEFIDSKGGVKTYIGYEYDCEVIVYKYVKNWSAAPDEVVSGMLLYAGTDDAIQPNNDYQMSGNQISVKTLDMDCDFSKIAAQLDSIADRIK